MMNTRLDSSVRIKTRILYGGGFQAKAVVLRFLKNIMINDYDYDKYHDWFLIMIEKSSAWKGCDFSPTTFYIKTLLW